MFDEIKNTASKIFERLLTGDGNHLTPVAVLSIDGQAFGTETMSRIISVSVTENRGFEADDCTIELDDSDGLLNIPNRGSIIKVWLGYKETGVVEKGEFKLGEFAHSGSPDKLSLTARAADLAESLAEQQSRSWHNKTVHEIVSEIAKRHGYPVKINDVYQQEKINHIDQTSESDASFLTRLAEQYDAIATVKNKTILFMPIGQAQTVSGIDIPEVVITRLSGDNHSFSYSDTDNYNAVRANYVDNKTGKQHYVLIDKTNADEPRKVIAPAAPKGKDKKKKTKPAPPPSPINTEGLKIKTIRHLYSSQANATKGARAAYRHIKRGLATFSLNLAMGRPDISPETPVMVAGFKPIIDAESWLIKKISHSVGDSGYTASIELESKLKFENDEKSGD